MTKQTVFRLALLFALSSAAAGQKWPLHFPEPNAKSIVVTKDVTFATADERQLKVDIYRPKKQKGLRPVVVFYTLFWPPDTSMRTSDWYEAWGRIAAAEGIVAVIPELRAVPGTGNASGPVRPLGDDFERFLSWLKEHATEYGIDRERVVLYAASGASWAALLAVQDPKQSTIKAMVIYYGAGSVETFRRDVPLLWVRAGKDSQRINGEIGKAIALALSQNVPITLVNHANGLHGFEGRTDDPVTRRIVQQTLDFIKQETATKAKK